MMNQLAPVRRTTPSGGIAIRPSETIRSGDLLAGVLRLTEREHGFQVGAGRMWVCDALRILPTKGMITVRPSGGVGDADLPFSNEQPFARCNPPDQYRRSDQVISGRRAMTHDRVHCPHNVAQSGAGCTTVSRLEEATTLAPARAQ